MGRTLGWTLVALASLSLVTGGVNAQKKQKTVTPDIANDQDYKHLQSVKDMTGTLASVNTNSITFRLDTPHLEPNPKYRPPKGNNRQHQQLQNIYRQQAQIMRERNPFRQQLRMQQLMATIQRDWYQQMLQSAAAKNNPNNQPFRLAHHYKDFDLDLSDKVDVRKIDLGFEYDDKGNLKTYSAQEKAALHGKDPNKPGYRAKLEDLEAGQDIKIYLRMPKKSKPASQTEKSEPEKAEGKDGAKDKDGGKDKDATKDKGTEKDKSAVDKAVDKADANKAKGEVVKPVIRMIVILRPLDSDSAAAILRPKQKRNK